MKFVSEGREVCMRIGDVAWMFKCDPKYSTAYGSLAGAGMEFYLDQSEFERVLKEFEALVDFDDRLFRPSPNARPQRA